MRIQVGGLTEGIHEYSFEVAAEVLGLGEKFSKGVTVRAALDKSGTQFHLKAKIRTVGSFDCDRCITRFDTPLDSVYQMIYVPDSVEHDHFDPVEVQVIPANFNVIDLSEDVRQTILLSVPLKVVCSDGCEGLCPRCGANLNTEECTCTEHESDVRWEALRQLRDSSSDD